MSEPVYLTTGETAELRRAARLFLAINMVQLKRSHAIFTVCAIDGGKQWWYVHDAGGQIEVRPVRFG